LKAPDVPEVVNTYISESHRAATVRQRGWVVAASAVALAASGLAVFAFLQRKLAVTHGVRVTKTLASSDLQRGVEALLDLEQTPFALAFLARAARAGNELAMSRLWTTLQVRSFWLPWSARTTAARHMAPQPDQSAVTSQFSYLDVNGETTPASSILSSPDGRFVLTVVGQPMEHNIQARLWTSSGSPCTSCFTPTDESGQWTYSLRGTFSPDSRYLALEVGVWRMPSFIEFLDLSTMSPLDRRIRAQGAEPRTQNTEFTHVEFLEDGVQFSEPSWLLLTAAMKGDATVFRICRSSLARVWVNRHQRGVILAAVDEQRDWLMSVSADGVVMVSSMQQRQPIGHHIRLAARPTALRRVNQDALVACMTDEVQQSFLDYLRLCQCQFCPTSGRRRASQFAFLARQERPTIPTEVRLP